MLILFIINFIKACPYPSIYTSITNTNSLIPINHIITQLKQPILLTSIPQFTNLTLNQKITNYTFPNIEQLQFNIQSVLTFTFTNNTYQTIGYAIIDNVTINMQFQYNDQAITIQQITTSVPNAFTSIQTMNYYVQYQYLVNLMNAQLISQITNAYQTLQFTLPTIKNEYLYQYTNINKEQQTIDFIYEQQYKSYQDQILITYGQLNINDYDQNECENTTLPNNATTLPQVQVFSNSILQTIILYGYQQNYFNVVLNQNWQSQDFQFFVGSLQYLFYNLDKYDPFLPINGFCNLTELPILNIISIQLLYQCNLEFNELTIVQFSLNLTLKIKFQQIYNTIQIICDDYSYQLSRKYNEKYPPKVYSITLETVIINSILNTHIKNSFLFGSGFITIPRRNSTIYVTNDYLMIFEY